MKTWRWRLLGALLVAGALATLTTLAAVRIEAVPGNNSCDGCHPSDMPKTWVSVVVAGQTATDITYDVTGSNNYDRPEGWAVFDATGANISNGFAAGSFTLPKDGNAYRVYWVDDADTSLNNPPSSSKGGSAYDDFTTANEPDPVGGIAELPGLAQAPAAQSESPAGNYAAVAGALAVAVFAVAAGTWYARKRSGT
jgi:hypothetical protein